MTQILGLPLDQALLALAADGIKGVRVQVVRAPRNPDATGTQRVIRMSQDGQELLVAHFPDEVAAGELGET